MILCIDTATKFLSLTLIKDGKIVGKINEVCLKKQSELIFVRLEKLFQDKNVSLNDIKAVCVSEGPGSYTGVRIGLTIGKVLCELNPEIELYKISTLKLYANNLENCLVLFDARANRAYYGVYDKGITIKEDSVNLISLIELNNYNLVGDLSLVGKEDFYFEISECFLNNLNNFELVKDVSFLIPKYLKSENDYLK